MAKNIVICCDGTWNTPDQKDGGKVAPTNVVKIKNALMKNIPGGREQHIYYHPGVGTDGAWWNKVLGGGIGLGLDKNIQSAYHELCEYYDEGDDVFVFGFSRGAYTVRSLVGFASHCGLLDLSAYPSDDEKWDKIDTLYRRGYRRRSETQQSFVSQGFKFKTKPNLPIHFIGVWDTVGALGVPDDMAFLNLLDSLQDHTFHSTDFSPNVKIGRHAVAMDEIRGTFQPTLWTKVPESADVKQKWFPGVHSDVGGGYADTGLSDRALQWMMAEAAGKGLGLNPKMVAQISKGADSKGELHNSCDGIFAFLPTLPRSTPFIEAPSNDLDGSVTERYDDPPISQAPYRPNHKLKAQESKSIDVFADQHWNATGLYLETGRQYTLKAAGQWLDSHIACGPEGADGTFNLEKVGYVLGTALGKVEEAFKFFSGNKFADFKFTRRHEDAPWFALMGAVANGAGVDVKGRLHPHEFVKIGSGCSFTPKKSGHFYVYANDAWNCYGNNRGKVRLTVT